MTLLLSLLLAGTTVTGLVWDDADGNGRREGREKGLAGVVVSDGRALAVTAADGSYRLEAGGRNVFVVLPGDLRPTTPWWRPRAEAVDFGLAADPALEAWRFAHLSDTHLHAGNVERTRRAFALAREGKAALAIVSGDLIRDALRVGEDTARGEFALYAAEVARAGLPVWSGIGNHEVFGVERHLSLVPPTHPAYGKRMYEEILGPRYYAFSRGRVHFLMLDTVAVDDIWYYGAIDVDQLEWIRSELAHVPPGTTIVTVGHIGFRIGAQSRFFAAEGRDRTLLTVEGVTYYRHVVRNASALAEVLKPYRWTLALQGHTHMGERLRFLDETRTRFHTAPAVDRAAFAPVPSGIAVYSVKGDAVDDGDWVIID
ncbi:MAG: metallophosphoesterase [Acidobacteria bacterium]|nr:metallophosphoesterase [Acidobacteriota bacterium]